MKNTQGGALLLVKLQAEASSFTKSNTPPWVFFTLLKLYNGIKLRKASQIIKMLLHWNYYLEEQIFHGRTFSLYNN